MYLRVTCMRKESYRHLHHPKVERHIMDTLPKAGTTNMPFSSSWILHWIGMLHRRRNIIITLVSVLNLVCAPTLHNNYSYSILQLIMYTTILVQTPSTIATQPRSEYNLQILNPWPTTTLANLSSTSKLYVATPSTARFVGNIYFCRLLSKENKQEAEFEHTRERFTCFHPLIIACVHWGGVTKVTLAFHKRLGNTSIILMAKPSVTQGAPIIIPGQRIDRNLDNKSLESRSFGHWVSWRWCWTTTYYTQQTPLVLFLE